MTAALLYEPYRETDVRCGLCSHHCVITLGARGICGVRENREGTLVSRVYGKIIAANIDPIEKKPLFHFMPGSLSFSLATAGCNFKCRFCQNADISQKPLNRGAISGKSATPEAVVDHAVKSGCRSISYTYTEPTVYFEFAMDTARLAAKKGLKNAFVTNGYMTPEALRMAAPCLDGANVDLKAFRNEFYKIYCGARLGPVLDTLRLMKQLGIFVEVTTLLITGLNDDERELTELAAFIREDLGPDTPWHVSRFHPTYKMTDRPSTPVETVVKAREIGVAAGLRYVYVGNIRDENGENTFCHQCGRLLIARRGFSVIRNHVTEGVCPQCRTGVAGVGMSG